MSKLKRISLIVLLILIMTAISGCASQSSDKESENNALSELDYDSESFRQYVADVFLAKGLLRCHNCN